MLKRLAPVVALVSFSLTAGAALSHSGVKDPLVKARMMLMENVAKDMKVLGGIAKGVTPFDPALAEKHGASLAEHANGIIPAFAQQADDPKSEALPNIWTDTAGFADSAQMMRMAAEKMQAAETADQFQTAWRALGQSCKDCHQTYRE